MRGLHVVGISDDGTQLLLAGSPDAARPSHAVPLDGRLRAAVNGDWKADGRPLSALSPKEIQARLRAGESVEDVARAAGVPLARVMPYAAPVLSERERIVEDARAATPTRDRGTPAAGPLGPTADTRLAGTPGLKAETVTWGARRRDDGAWVVTLDYAARGGARHAEWLWQPAERSLRSLGAAATRLTAPDAAATKPRSATRRTGRSGARPAGRTGRAAAAGSSTAAAKRSAPPAPRSEEPAEAPAPRRRKPEGPTPVPARPVGSSWSDVLFGVADSQVVADATERRATTSRSGRSPARPKATPRSAAARSGSKEQPPANRRRRA